MLAMLFGEKEQFLTSVNSSSPGYGKDDQIFLKVSILRVRSKTSSRTNSGYCVSLSRLVSRRRLSQYSNPSRGYRLYRLWVGLRQALLGLFLGQWEVGLSERLWAWILKWLQH